MGWITRKTTTAPATPRRPGRSSEGLFVPIAVQQRIAELLVRHGRFVFSNGHLRLHILGTTRHHDGSTDYAVRSAIPGDHGRETVYNSHVRIYPTDHLRLIR